MGISLKPQHLKRYRDIALLLVRYGRRDLAQLSGIEALIAEEHQGLANEEAPKAEQLARDLERLGPTFIKVGQFLSTRPDIVPSIYLEALSRLQDSVQPFGFDEVERIVSRELGVRLSKAFSCFEAEPIAAASLGQVHRATLRDGRLVAVKVQRPDIHEVVLEDLDALEDVAAFLDEHTEIGRRYRFVPMLEELRKTLLRELDYRQEARNLNVVGSNLAQFPRLVVPSPVDDYVTSRVLTMDYIRGRKITAVGPLARLDIDGEALADELCHAYLHQVLVDGFFHADPHPGNVFLTDDGAIALLDLGMVAHLPSKLQDQLLKLLLAVSEGRGDDAASIALQIAEPHEEDHGVDEAGFRRKVAELVLELKNTTLADLQLGRVVLEVGRLASAHGLVLPRELMLLGKTLLNVDRVATHIAPEFDPNASIRRNAAAILNERMRKKLSPGKVFAGLLEMSELVERLPGQIIGLMDAIAHNRLRVKVDTIDEAVLMVGMQKVANRITLGLVLSALIVGAALLMRINTDFRILGYPGLAILFFLGAALGGLGLVLSILVGDLHQRRR